MRVPTHAQGAPMHTLLWIIVIIVVICIAFALVRRG
jgi:hypothetical protein